MGYRSPKLNEAELKAALESKGVPEALTYYETVVITADTPFAEKTIADLVSRLRQWGTLSEKQEKFLVSLVQQVKERPALEAKWAAEKAAAPNVPEGNIVITGTVLKEELKHTRFGLMHKAVIKTDAGYTVYGTLPSKISHAKRGDRVSFLATVKPSDRDPKFGFYSRPTQAEILNNEVQQNG